MNAPDRWIDLISASQRAGAVTKIDDQLELAVRLGVGIAPDAVGCSITEVADGQRYSTIAASSRMALELDQAQYDGGTGPCMQAALTGELQRIEQMESDSRFGDFPAAAYALGVSSSLSLPLRGARRRAALNFYAASSDGFDSPRAKAVATLLARCTVTLLDPSDGAVHDPALAKAREHGAVVTRAEDILMQSGLSRAQAFGKLISAANARSVPVRLVAGEMVGEH
jgi:hypothetical protein